MSRVAVQVVGVSLQPEVLEQLDVLAEQDEIARSAMIARLVTAEHELRRGARRDAPLKVVVNGVIYTPKRQRARAAG